MQNDNFIKQWVDKLDKFDWGYEYSDDGRVYQNGKDELAEMTEEWKGSLPTYPYVLAIIEELKKLYNEQTLNLKSKYSFCSNLKLWDEIINDLNSYPNKVVRFLLINQNKECTCN